MLKQVGCSHCIIGHSERRHTLGETNVDVNRKVKAALKHRLTPILCVGETLAERDAEKTAEVVTTHVTKGLAGLSVEQVGSVIIAYEPVWAIGTGLTATPEQAEDVHALIRTTLRKLHGDAVADGLRILYGGSVKGDNIKGLMAKREIDGVLVGGASLKADPFMEIVRGCAR
jgi:triosephosphate isomerase